ncbi:MAG: hypothetical protein ACRENS_00190 [Candidatus Eiseniibacteriota bacterium]
MIGVRRVLKWLRNVAVLALLAALIVYVWPTRFRYDHVSVDGNTYPVRIDRFSGDSDMLVPDQGWVPVEGDSEGGDSGTTQPAARHV